jgi:hypothetical protein
MRPNPPPDPDHDALAALVRAADEALDDDAVLGVHGAAPGTGRLAWTPLGGLHPLDALLGAVAPPHWCAVGVRTRGVATGPDGTDDVVVTLLVGRTGASASTMRRGDTVVPLPGRPDGTIADACRRALGLPTAPPPGSTALLWTLSWLDRVVAEASARPPGDRRSWAEVARWHPAVAGGLAAGPGTPSPAAVAGAARALAEAWPWPQLRSSPAVVDVPGGPPDLSLSRWMDDGMWARWVLGAFPALDDLVAATRALLTPVVADGVDLVVRRVTA